MYTGTYMYNNFLHSRFIVLKYGTQTMGREGNRRYIHVDLPLGNNSCRSRSVGND